MHEEIVDNILHSLIPEHYDKKETEKRIFTNLISRILHKENSRMITLASYP
jgi:hypothetical protein